MGIVKRPKSDRDLEEWHAILTAEATISSLIAMTAAD